ncbi:hypothetical protein GE061_008306 [Apolygus lucorum]|uniref:Uncharacterized protein n=1 Tax=Apolygus lucorum TaxID=248454 RepID=A0A6A4J0R5_APOLU|nr:hypothetical protein GE061_008306 [Apolygus lucorum]
MVSSSPSRSTGCIPFKLMTGTEMRLNSTANLKRMSDEEMPINLNEEQDEIRTKAKKNIEKVQTEERKTFNRRRKKPRLHNVGDMVAIRRTQPGSKIKRTKPNDDQRIVSSEEMIQYLKPWIAGRDGFNGEDASPISSRTRSHQDGRV